MTWSIPTDANDERLAGKTFSYTVKVQSVKQKTLPELNDDFAKELGGVHQPGRGHGSASAKAWKQERKHAAEHEAKDKLVAELVKRNEFEVPEALVERQVDIRLERGLRALAAQGMRAEDIKKMDFDRLRAGQREQAVQDVKARCCWKKWRKKRKSRSATRRLNRKSKRSQLQAKQPVEAIRARLTQDGALDRIRNQNPQRKDPRLSVPPVRLTRTTSILPNKAVARKESGR